MKEYIKKVVCDRETYRLTIILIPILTVLSCLDYKDLIIGKILNHDWKLILIIGFGVIALGIIVFVGNHYLDLFKKIPTVNILDRVALLFVISDVVYSVFLLLINQVKVYKVVFLLITFVVCVVLIICRGIRFSILSKSHPQNTSKVYDLKQLLEIGADTDLSYPILISEKDVDYDLFDRKEIVFQLETALEISCKSDYPFVVGLTGKWGSGKTTILNIVKKHLLNKDGLVVIDSFDPWKYASSKAMLVDMYYTILQNTGVRYSEGQINEMINTVCDLVAETNEKAGKLGKIAKRVLSQGENNNSVDVLKNKIDEYLKLNDLTIVFIIDNLDRATAENVRFVFKLVGAVFDFEKVKYVLSYDKQRLSDIFYDSLQIDPRYMEKIINQELVVPKIPDVSREFVYRKCIINLLLSFGVSVNDLSDYEYIIKFIIDYVQDIRMFKRLLNSAFFLSFGKNDLYKPDLLTLEIIRFLDLELYESIYQNKKYFIDVDTIYDSNIYRSSIKINEFNTACGLFYDKLFKGKKHLQQLLSYLFPYIKRYTHGQAIKQDGSTSKEEYKKTQLYSRINSAKYFDLYFCYSINDFSILSVEFNKSLERIITLPEDRITDAFTEFINSISLNSQFEWALKLYLSKDDIEGSAAYPILISLFENIQQISDERGFLTPSPRDRVYAVMADIYKRLDVDKQKSFIQKCSDNITQLFVITNMINWLDETKDEVIITGLRACAKKICDKILHDSINVYDDPYYSKGNIWSIYHTLKSSNTQKPEQVISDYIAGIISPKIIYRVLGDTVISSIGRQYGYYISKDDYSTLFSDEINIQDFLDNNAPSNESEKLIYDLYQDYINYSGNDPHEHERYFDYPFVFNL